MRDSWGIFAGYVTDTAQECESKSADEWIAIIECEAIADKGPDHADNGHQDEALHHGREYVFTSHQSAIKQCQSGAGHHQHQSGADQHPCGIAAFDFPGGVADDDLGGGSDRASGGSNSRCDHW